MANKSFYKGSGSSTVKQRNTYSTPSNNSVKMTARKPVSVQMTQKTNQFSNQQLKAIFARGTNTKITQRGSGNNRVAMSVPRGTTIRVRGNSKVKVG